MSDIDTEEEMRLRNVALLQIRRKFEIPVSGKPLLYHNRAHTEAVIARADRLAEAIELGPRERMMVRLAAAFHDICIEWVFAENRQGYGTREPCAGANEVLSAAEAMSQLRTSSLNFTACELGMIAQAIIATTPKWDDAHDTVVQPLVGDMPHSITACVAMADLGEAGMDPESFIQNSYRLFAELNDGLFTCVSNKRAMTEVECRTLVRWFELQVDFVEGRRVHTGRELSWFPGKHGHVLQELFSGFIPVDTAVRLELKMLRMASPSVAAERMLEQLGMVPA